MVEITQRLVIFAHLVKGFGPVIQIGRIGMEIYGFAIIFDRFFITAHLVIGRAP